MSTDKAKGYKTLAIRLDDDVHAQLQVIARLLDSSIADEIRQAIAAHLQTKRSDPELSSRASQVRESIEHEAQVRQDAIANLFTEQPAGDPPKGRSTRSRKTSDDEAKNA
jgi:plasmid stability protein